MFDVFLVTLGLTFGAGLPGSGGIAGMAPVPVAGSALVAEDQTPTGKFLTAGEVRPILTATRGNWIAIREWNGQDLVYVTHVWSWRCGLLQMEVSVNDGPAEIWDLPACREDSPQPTAILDEDGLPYRAFGSGSVQQVTVTLTYDDLSTDSVTFRRQDVLMP